MEWKEIKREDGIATDESMKQMCAMLPIAVLQKSDSSIMMVHKGNWDIAGLDLILKSQITHYCPLPQLPEDNVDIF